MLNAVVGLRQEGKAESAMNALKSMMKATARVRRDGVEAEIPAEQVVVGDVVLLAAGDQVPADGRIVAASALQIDESALTGESTPGRQGRGDAGRRRARARRPDEHGVHEHAGHARQRHRDRHRHGRRHRARQDLRDAVGDGAEKSPLTKELNPLTLWIVGAAGLTMIVMFVLGRSRGVAWDALFVSAVSLAIAAIPEALPTVTQTILSLGGVDLAKRNAIVKELPSVETLGFTSAINSDKTGTLTMNQMTAVEVVDPTDRYTISGIGYGLEGRVQHAAGGTDTIEDAILPYLIANDAKLVDGEVVGDPTEGALLVLGHKAGLDIDATRERLPRLATLPFDPTYKLMATFNSAIDAAGRPVVRCFVKGAAPAVMARAATALSATAPASPGTPTLGDAARTTHGADGEAGQRVMAAAIRDLDPATLRPGRRPARLRHRPADDEPGRHGRPAPRRVHGTRSPTRRPPTSGSAWSPATTSSPAPRSPSSSASPARPSSAPTSPRCSEAERLARIDDIGVVGRVAPEHKVLLADTLKKKGDVVAMTGDGVNDAPAIKAADIGIAMGTGTEVAKNAGRMILSDDNFATIVFAVEQGRKIYDNLTKYIRFVLVLLVVFVLTFLGASLFNIAAGEPFTPAQVLWIHFVVNAPFGFALGFDRETPGLMARRRARAGESRADHSA